MCGFFRFRFCSFHWNTDWACCESSFEVKAAEIAGADMQIGKNMRTMSNYESAALTKKEQKELLD